MTHSRIFLIAAAALSLAVPARAAEVKNLRSGQQGNKAFAVYDLAGKPGELDAEVKVVIEVGGEKYTSDRLTLRGDLGKGVKVGVGRRIEWDLLKDMPAGFDGEVTWDVDAVAPRAPASPGIAGEITDPWTGITLLPVPGGCFTMGDGSGDGDGDEKPVHQVCLDPFHLGKFEVTQAQWHTVMGNNPSYFKQCGKNCPVESVSWNDIQSFLEKLNKRTGKRYRLPTEAEWEYAAGGGERHTTYPGSGTRPSELAWEMTNSGGKVHPAGLKKPNVFGIHDLSGNVAEWVQDFKDDYQAAPQNAPKGPESGRSRVLRGGSWLSPAGELRTSARSELNPSVKSSTIGFRVLLPDEPDGK
ncbi:hypothetical protein GMSM_24090 [Geomonas sp. Red276]